MLRSMSARLAVLLFIIPIVLTIRATAEAGLCVTTPTGIECSYGGTTTSIVSTTQPPLRYLATTTSPSTGPCWYWSRFPPGLDSQRAANEHAIITTRRALPECRFDRPAVIDTRSAAWRVFRSWVFPAPSPRIRPSVGITNLASMLTTQAPRSLHHSETLPDGRRLEVRASVDSVTIDWGDGSPAFGHSAQVVFGSGAPHPYRLKTCPLTYRREHPMGGGCHPTLSEYRVTVTHVWTGRYRAGGSWIVLGTIPRSTSFFYDVDEVVGVPVAP